MNPLPQRNNRTQREAKRNHAQACMCRTCASRQGAAGCPPHLPLRPGPGLGPDAIQKTRFQCLGCKVWAPPQTCRQSYCQSLRRFANHLGWVPRPHMQPKSRKRRQKTWPQRPPVWDPLRLLVCVSVCDRMPLPLFSDEDDMLLKTVTLSAATLSILATAAVVISCT